MNAPLEARDLLALRRAPRARRRTLTAIGTRVLIEVHYRHDRLRRYVRRTLTARGRLDLLPRAMEIMEEPHTRTQRELYELFTTALEDVIRCGESEVGE